MTHFDGATYCAELDHARLTGQARRVWDAISDGHWLTLRELADATGDPEASVSARLRDFRKDRWGGHRIDRRRRGNTPRGTWEYRKVGGT